MGGRGGVGSRSSCESSEFFHQLAVSPANVRAGNSVSLPSNLRAGQPGSIGNTGANTLALGNIADARLAGKRDATHAHHRAIPPLLPMVPLAPPTGQRLAVNGLEGLPTRRRRPLTPSVSDNVAPRFCVEEEGVRAPLALLLLPRTFPLASPPGCGSARGLVSTAEAPAPRRIRAARLESRLRGAHRGAVRDAIRVRSGADISRILGAGRVSIPGCGHGIAVSGVCAARLIRRRRRLRSGTPGWHLEIDAGIDAA
mmetsp:Transcript_50805/g.121000  ORF Transcript_50805/g.121000 Transcript_50805/m.121000 type:complete len:255 (+) Transcript_50805:2-766(+)